MERVQEAVTYFFHFTSLSIHHRFSQKLCPISCDLTLHESENLTCKPFFNIFMLSASASPCGNELERDTAHVPLLDIHWGRPVHFPRMAGAASLCSTVVALCCTFHLVYNLSKKEAGGRGSKGPELHALLKMQPHHRFI